MKTPTKATAPETGEISSYLTNGKTYDITRIIKNSGKYYGLYFEIICDNGYICRCLQNKCSHLNDLNWKLS